MKIVVNRETLSREFDVYQLANAEIPERESINERMKKLGIERWQDRRHVFDVAKGFVEKEKRKEEKEGQKADSEGAEIVEVSFYESDGVLYEEVYNDEGISFARFDNGSVKYVKRIDEGERMIFPIPDKEVEKRAVLLPSKVESYGSAESLVKEIKDFSTEYLDIPDDYRTFACHYPLLSTIQDKINNVPYLRTLGDTGTGKSRFIDTFGRICYKPIIMAGSVSAAPIFRLQGKWGGTICIEEADRKNSSETDDVITALNCGFERGRPFPRCDKNDPNKVEFFDVFGCKVLGSRFRFKDKALESRCLTTVMQETERKDIPATLPDKFFEKQQELRNKLLAFRFDYRSQITSDSIQRIDLGDIEMRLKQMASPFAVLFEPMPSLFNKFQNFIQKYNQELIEERSGTLEGLIVQALIDLEGQEGISAKNLSERLSDNYGQEPKDVSAQKIGNILKSLGIQRKDKRTEEGVRKCVIWDAPLIKKLGRRYIPITKKDVRLSATVATAETAATKQQGNVASVASVAAVSREPEDFFIVKPKREVIT